MLSLLLLGKAMLILNNAETTSARQASPGVVALPQSSTVLYGCVPVQILPYSLKNTKQPFL